MRYSNFQCLPEYYFPSMEFKKVMFGYAIFTFNQFYTLPMICFICKLFTIANFRIVKNNHFISVLYSNVLYALYNRQHEDLENSFTLGPPPKAVSNASTILTKNAILVTIIFILSFTYDLW